MDAGSMLLDILHLPFDWEKDNRLDNISHEEKVERCLNAFNALFDTLTEYNRHDDIKFLLLEDSQFGFNPLHQALMSDSRRVFKAYTDKLLQTTSISKNEFISLIAQRLSNSCLNTLHLAICMGNIEILKDYFDFLGKLYEKRLLSSRDLLRLFTAPDREWLTPFLQAAYSSVDNCNYLIMKEFINNFKDWMKASDLSSETIKEKGYLEVSDIFGRNVLHIAAHSSQSDLVEEITDFLKWALGQQDASELLSKLAQQRNQYGQTPLSFENQKSKIKSLRSRYSLPSKRKRYESSDELSDMEERRAKRPRIS